MISILLYGRNDVYGALAQQRAALSINVLAASLTHKDDEIIFVDYNSDDDIATFPEILADTLTTTAIERLKVVRVRAKHHLALAGDNAPPVVESIARNIGLRHSSPSNPWILSTNADVLLVSGESSISDIVRELKPACYGAPRYELPRFLWEGLDRKAPDAAIGAIIDWSRRLHLDEAVYHYLPQIGFDGPGDFQLIPRDRLIEVGGFDEAIKNAWHVDSNIFARLALEYGPVQRMHKDVRIYHCEHTATTAIKHASGRIEDSFDDFVLSIRSPYANSSKEWGGARFQFEVFNLRRPTSSQIAKALDRSIGSSARTTPGTIYGPETFGRVPRYSQHTLPFIVDRLAHLPHEVRLGWLGTDEELRRLVQTTLASLGRCNALDFCPLKDADYVLIDVPVQESPSDEAVATFWSRFAEFVAREDARLKNGMRPRKILFINAINSQAETILLQYFDVIFSPFTSRLRPAAIKTTSSLTDFDWLTTVSIGEAGKRHSDNIIAFGHGVPGHVFFGPRQKLLSGRYTLTVTAHARGWRQAIKPRSARRLVLEVVSGDTFLAQQDVFVPPRGKRAWNVSFFVDSNSFAPHVPGVEVRLWTSGQAEGQISQITVMQDRE